MAKKKGEIRDELQAKTAARYVVGIDLGTTNSAVAFVDTTQKKWQVERFDVPQLITPGQIEHRESLPSFHYEPIEGEIDFSTVPADVVDPQGDHIVGTYARDHGSLTPGRMIASAKSWLCHSGVDRTADLLPWHGADDVRRLSPVDVSGRILEQIRRTWDARFSDHPLAEQDIVLTLPASFDEVARQLTIKAAAQAGLRRVVLIEEPQAAFYAWIDCNSGQWENLVAPGQKILICDVGGGTSDFTLIRVRPTADQRVQFHRVAVGDHLILGGDNLDLALAKHIEQRLAEQTPPVTLNPRQWSVLIGAARSVKERLLGDDPPERTTVNLPGGGRKLIGASLQVEVTRDEVVDVLLDGFLPDVPLDARPAAGASGFQEFGLPYAADPAITRHVANFLTTHRMVATDDVDLPEDVDPARPDVILYNGGLFESPAVRERLTDTIAHWFGGETSDWRPTVLLGERLHLAVARGAAYYGMVRRGRGVRIAAGLARTYYIGVETDEFAPTPEPEETEDIPEVEATEPAEPQLAAVCLLPARVEPGQEVELKDREFLLRTNEPVEFPLFVSSTRLTDPPGELIRFDPERMTALPPIRTVLRTRKKGESEEARVTLHAKLTEIGTLELWCTETGEGRGSWQLQFDVRSATQTDVAAHRSAAEAEGFVDEEIMERCQSLIEATIGEDRSRWPASLCRRLWSMLIDCEAGRRRSPAHEARWVNLVGYTLRPGFGLAVDDWRVARTWQLLKGQLIHGGGAVRGEGWILWRRIAGGLPTGSQQSLAQPLIRAVRSLHRQLEGKGGGGFNFPIQDTAELWRLLGSLEWLPVTDKVELGRILIDIYPRRKMEPVRDALAWAIGRIGARVPLYGPLNAVVPPDEAAAWLGSVMKNFGNEKSAVIAMMELARRTDDRYRDVPDKIRRKAIRWLIDHDAPDHLVNLVEQAGQLDQSEQAAVFGESLPQGLRLSAES